MKKICLTIILWLCLAGFAFSATYYVKQSASGTGDGSNCTNADDLATVMTTVDDDDVVVLCNGTFSTTLNPTNSGSSGNPITFQKDTGATVTFTGANLTGDDYIVLNGLTFSGGGEQIDLDSSDHVEITGCTFGLATSKAISMSYTTYAYIHDNTFNAQVEATSELNEKDTIRLSNATFNRIIDNTFNDGGGHSFIMIRDYSHHNVVRGNNFNITDHFSTQNATLDLPYMIYNGSTYNLMDQNIFTEDSGSIGYNAPHLYSTSYNIVRRNVHNFIYYNFSVKGSGTTEEYNCFYNNTFYDVYKTGGEGFIRYTNDGTSRYDFWINNIIYEWDYRAMYVDNTANINNLTFKNNIFYDGNGSTETYWKGTERTIAYLNTNSPLADGSVFSGNLTSEPTFTNAAGGDFSPSAAGAPQVDAGAWLTTVNGGTTGTTFLVDDYPYMFYPGWGDDTANADVIKTENGQTCTIASINYGTKQITCSTSITVIDGEGVALSYNGTKPDIGAEEYGGTPPVPCENFDPADEATGVSITIDLTFDGQVGETFDVYFDDTDCTTLQCDDASQSGGTVTCDVGTLANSDTFYWKVHANTANQNFPSTGCFEFTTTGTPPSVVVVEPDATGVMVVTDSTGVVVVPE